jgi:hypothetical protein
MSDANTQANDPHAAGDVRALRMSFLGGAVLGAIYGTSRYGFFTMQNIAMAGLGIITLVALHAAWIGIRPARA